MLERSTKAGVETPATRRSAGSPGPRRQSLNEGRGRNPGDTRVLELVMAGHVQRSTKAGVETPATRAISAVEPHSIIGRSTKAGVETPATPPGRYGTRIAGRPLNEGRGRNPGDTPPLTAYKRSWRRTLNEGRGRNPGDTSSLARRNLPSVRPLNEGRGRNPGDTSPRLLLRLPPVSAQRRPGSKPRRHNQRDGDPGRRQFRSTKAGVETPATRLRGFVISYKVDALNEGRGRNPGDTPNCLNAAAEEEMMACGTTFRHPTRANQSATAVAE